ncbi:MAG: histidine phosphatase family protein [Ilumatobacteraceae bacterium]|nr:histidine phosphatase family protein [Ilumatobacteraceae bacterium]
MESTLYLVRHGQADETGDADPGLTERGRAEAHAIGLRLQSVRFDAILHSSRRRARETAVIVARSLSGCEPEHSQHADDRTPIPTDVSGMSANLLAFLDAVPADERDVDGRSLDGSIAALGRGVGSDRQLLVVTHNFVIGWFVRDALGAPSAAWTRLNSANGALTIVRYRTDEPTRLIAFNDTGHLPRP